MLRIHEIIRSGQDFDVFNPVDRIYEDRYGGGYVQKTETTLCYKGLDCIFFERRQFLVLRHMLGQICYAGYCDNIKFFFSG